MRYNQEQLRQLSDDQFKKYYNSYVLFFKGLQPEQRQGEAQYASLMKAEFNTRVERRKAAQQFQMQFDQTVPNGTTEVPCQSRQIRIPPQRNSPHVNQNYDAYNVEETPNRRVLQKELPLAKSKCLFASGLIGCFYAFYSVAYLASAGKAQASTAATIGAGIAAMLMMPHVICAVLAAIFNLVGWVNNKRGFALTGAILYCVAAILFPLNALFVLPEIVLSFVGYAKLKTIKQNDIRVSEKRIPSYVTAICFVAIGLFGVSLGNTPQTPSEPQVSQSQSTPANANVTVSNPASEQPQGQYVTLEMFNSVSEGNSYEDVVALFGYEGELTSSMENAQFGIKTENYSWKGKDGFSSVAIVFSDGKVSTKMQMGLE